LSTRSEYRNALQVGRDGRFQAIQASLCRKIEFFEVSDGTCYCACLAFIFFVIFIRFCVLFISINELPKREDIASIDDYKSSSVSIKKEVTN